MTGLLDAVLTMAGVIGVMGVVVVLVLAPLRLLVYAVMWVWCRLRGHIYEEKVWW